MRPLLTAHVIMGLLASGGPLSLGDGPPQN